MTAVEWLLEQLEGTDSKIARVIGLKKYNEIVRQAKAMEKERMKGMYVEGSFAKMRYYDGLEYIDAEQYYNETYGKAN